MPFQQSIDKAGRIVIPKSVRDQLGLTPGDTLELDSTGERITLRPVRTSSALVKEHGVWILQSGSSYPAKLADDVLEQVREERFRAILGEDQ